MEVLGLKPRTKKTRFLIYMGLANPTKFGSTYETQPTRLTQYNLLEFSKAPYCYILWGYLSWGAHLVQLG